jgi:hypothetical protein
MDTIVFALGAALPHGWVHKESLTLLDTDGQANVVFSSEPVAEDIDTEKYAGIQGSLLGDEFPGYEEFVFETTRLSGHEAFYRRFQWAPPGGEPVTQIQTYLVIDGRGYTATATSLSTNFHDFDDLFGDVLERLSIPAGPV